MVRTIAVAAVLLLSAQAYSYVMVVHKSASTDQTAVADISKITFTIDTMSVHKFVAGTVLTAVKEINKITFTDAVTGVVPEPEGAEKIMSVAAKIFPSTYGTRIEYSVPDPACVKIAVFNMSGQAVKTLLNRNVEKGRHITTWNFRDESGRRVSSGSYVVGVEIAGMPVSKTLFIVH